MLPWWLIAQGALKLGVLMQLWLRWWLIALHPISAIFKTIRVIINRYLFFTFALFFKIISVHRTSAIFKIIAVFVKIIRLKDNLFQDGPSHPLSQGNHGPSDLGDLQDDQGLSQDNQGLGQDNQAPLQNSQRSR
jgi:hypothetical protein